MKARKPIVGTVGNAKVKICRRIQQQAPGAYPVFEICDYTSGKRVLRSFAREMDARTKATEIATRLTNMEGVVLTLKDDDRQFRL